MNYVRLGQSGLKITQITFGSALTIGVENTEKAFASGMIGAAWELGIRSFDCSNNYGDGKAEELVGGALAKYKRQEYVLSTKGSWPVGETPYHRGLSRKHILWACDESLKRLGHDYVDIYYAHRYDPETPMEEIVRVFSSLIGQGKIRYWATSEWPASALKECHAVCERLGLEKPIAEQFLYSYAVRKAENNGVFDFCKQEGVGVLGFSPLCQGLLTGKYRGGVPDGSRIAKSAKIGYDKTKDFYEQNKTRIDTFLEICDNFGVNPAQAAIRFCIEQGVNPVLGASSPEQLRENVRGLEPELPAGFMEALLAAGDQ